MKTIFVIQSDIDWVKDVDSKIIMDELDRENQKYVFSTLDILRDNNILKYYPDSFCVPIGTLEFVGVFLSQYYNIKKMNPIEIPKCLQLQYFVKRNYMICDEKGVPDHGRFFVKGVSKLKDFSFCGDISHIGDDIISKDANGLLPAGLYQVSDILDIVSEWRIFVHRNKIVGVNFYEGNPVAFPDKTLLLEAVKTYGMQEDCPKAYTIDVAVFLKNSKEETAILEIHPWVSVGIYGYIFMANLSECYRDGFCWYLEHNTPLMSTSEGCKYIQ